MPGDARPWNATIWEEHVQRLLKKRYAHPVGSYQHIPADVHGDCGLEGFAADGTAYQCYAAQNWQISSQLLTKQRNKMTRAISTFIKKENELLEILGGIKIGIWNFVVPFWNDKELLKHARKKETEVKARHLRHTMKDFRIAVITGEEFSVEEQLLVKIDLHKFDVSVPAMPPASITRWMDGKKNLQVVANLSRKATVIGAGRSEQQKRQFLKRMVENYIGGNVVLGKLEQEQPEIFERVMERKFDREGALEMECFSTTKVPAEFFESTLEQYRSDLTTVAGISGRVADLLAREAVSDWLLRCPMEFD